MLDRVQDRPASWKIREKLAIAGFSAIAGIVGDAIEGRQADAIARLGELFSQGVSAEGIVKDTADFFHALLLYKEGIRKPEILGSALEDIPVHIAEMLTREQLEAALKAGIQSAVEEAVKDPKRLIEGLGKLFKH